MAAQPADPGAVLAVLGVSDHLAVEVVFEEALVPSATGSPAPGATTTTIAPRFRLQLTTGLGFPWRGLQ